jgi:hypothetical protein
MVQKYNDIICNLLIFSCLKLLDNYKQLNNRVFYYFIELFFDIDIISIIFIIC